MSSVTPRLIRSAAIVAALSVVTGCGSRNIEFKVRPAAMEAPTVSLVYDRFGDIYPGNGVPTQIFLDHSLGKWGRLSPFYFAERKKPDSNAWQRLLRETGNLTIDASVRDSVAWAIIQDTLRQRVIDRVNAQADTRPLFILIHGFNNDLEGARSWYASVHDSVIRRVPTATFLHVHWDGLVAKRGPFFIWSKAQYNFPLVGLEFRRVLNRIHRHTPVRIIVHSSGAPMVATALDDASAGLPKAETARAERDNHWPTTDTAYANFVKHVRDTAGSYERVFPSDLRIGMLAPAMTPITFDRFGKDPADKYTLVFGINSRDYALTKTVVPCSWGGGSTCLGSHPEIYCDKVWKAFKGGGEAKKPGVKLFFFDFAKSKTNRARWMHSRWESHDMKAYLQRDDITRFLDLVVGPDSGRGDEAPTCANEKAREPR